jgi:intracellular sulfur oxidation DsrE/DsrF family protein
MAKRRGQTAQLMVAEPSREIHDVRHWEFRKGDGAIAALLWVAPSSEAQVNKKQSAQATKLSAATKTNSQATEKPHRLILQLNINEPAMMNPALNNASNVVQYYKDLGEKVSIEVVTFGPGLHMLRDDTSPEKAANRGARAEQSGSLLQSLRQSPRKHEQARKFRGSHKRKS